MLTEVTNGYTFTAPLQGCAATGATFSTRAYPGTYKVTVTGRLSNLPNVPYVAASALAVSAPVANLAYDVKVHTVSSAVTVNCANPLSSTTLCDVSATNVSN